MNIADKRHLQAQYWIKIHELNATEFQSFFEKMMTALHRDDFVKVSSGGGDEKNDGFKLESGVYYQAYAPENPKDEAKQAYAAKKMEDDFKGLYEKWNDRFPIKDFNFVFNDKNFGLQVVLLDKLAALRKEYPDVNIGILTPQKLEADFFRLPQDKMVELGFSVEKRTIITTLTKYLEGIEADLDRSCPKFALKSLDKIREAADSLDDEDDVYLEYGLLRCRALRNTDDEENAKNAESEYRVLSRLYPDDLRPILYLAEYYLILGDSEKAEELLNKAEEKDVSFWLLNAEKLVKELRQANPIDTSKIDENSFPEDKKARSILYRLHAICHQRNGNNTDADRFIEKAIQLNPDRLENYIRRLDFKRMRLRSEHISNITEQEKVENLKEVDEVIAIADAWGTDSQKDRIRLFLHRLPPLDALERNSELAQTINDVFALCLLSKYDDTIEEAFLTILSIPFSNENFEKLLNYLEEYRFKIRGNLVKALTHQFLIRRELLTKGKAFFTDKGLTEGLDFVNALEKKSVEDVIAFANSDLIFTQVLAVDLGDYPEIQKALLETLKDVDFPSKEKLWMIYYINKGENEKAFEILRKLDFDSFTSIECGDYAKVAHDNQAWDLEKEFLNKYLAGELADEERFKAKLRLFSANIALENLTQTISLGESLLASKKMLAEMDAENKEILLAQIVLAYIKRGEHQEGLELIKKHGDIPNSFNFKSGIQAEVYFKCGDKDSAIESILEGIKQLSNPTDEQYGSLFWHLVQIGDKSGFSLDTEGEVIDKRFVKLKDDERWYALGEENPLDAVSLNKSDARYNALLGKKIKDKVEFNGDRLAGIKERIIDQILPFEHYVFWKARDCFYKLGKAGSPMVQMIEVPNNDLGNIIAFMKERHEEDQNFFVTYCKENLPLALLAFQQGGITNAIGKITQENKGFIKFSDGTNEENIRQEKVAEKILNGNTIYLDALSALFLSETRLMEKIRPYIPQLKVPQSVINFLYDTVEKFRVEPGTTGRMGYANGKLTLNRVEQDEADTIREKIRKSAEILEANEENVETISKALKANVWSEQEMPAELSDACILAQKNNALVLTDDYLYLHVNALETKKHIPEYCSSFIFIKVCLTRGLLTFEEYLSYFAYLAKYRCRFLGFSVNELMTAIFGNGDLIVFRPENLRKFKFSLTLSEEYGVTLKTALRVIVEFLSKIIKDDSITIEWASAIFSEVLSTFLKARAKDKHNIASLLTPLCDRQIKIWGKNTAIIKTMELAQDKLNMLDEKAKLYVSNDLIINDSSF